MIVLIWFLIAVATYLILLALVLLWRIKFARGKLKPTTPFTRIRDSADYKILFLGDSTAVGMGASSPQLSVAGRFAERFPDSSISNFGVSGYRLSDLDKAMPDEGTYNLVVLQIGANDIIRFTPMSNVKKHLLSVVRQAKPLTDQIVIIHGGNIGAGPLFPWPLKLIYDWRTRNFRQLYIETAQDKNIAYAVIYKDLKTALNIERKQSTYGPDLFHPGDLGYQIWFDHILSAALASGFELPD